MKKHRLGVGVRFWNDEFGLNRLLSEPSLYRNVDHIYLLDGKYSDYEGVSETGKPFWLNLKPKYYYELMEGTQVEKKNRLYELAEQNDLDYLIIVDSDEVLKIYPKHIEPALKLTDAFQGSVFPITFNQQGDFKTIPRLFKGPFSYRHKQHTDNLSHNDLWRRDGERLGESCQKYLDYWLGHPVKGFYIEHDKGYRSEQRNEQDQRYYKAVPNR